MSIKNYLVHLFGGWTQEDLYHLDTNCLTCEHIKTNGKHTQQKEQQNNGMSRKVPDFTSEQKVSRVAYIGHLGDEVTAYSVRTDKSTSNTVKSDDKDVGKDKKKVRPVKQSGKRK